MDRHPHRDPEMIRLQAAHAGHLARRWRGDPAVLAWDLTDEPPFWLFRDTTDDDARTWTRALVDAIRAADPDVLVTIGTAGQEVGWGPFRADVVAADLDIATVHPYPIYEPDLYPDGLLGSRMTHAAAFETALAAGAGRPVMVHEYGASSTQFDPERIAAYDRLLCWSSLGRGATGFFAWCWTDAEPAAFGRAPYVRQPHETQFGVTDWTGALRPRGRVLADLAATVRRLDLDGLAADGPVATAAIPVPHEYARPYDPAAYGLADAPAGRVPPGRDGLEPGPRRDASRRRTPQRLRPRRPGPGSPSRSPASASTERGRPSDSSSSPPRSPPRRTPCSTSARVRGPEPRGISRAAGRSTSRARPTWRSPRWPTSWAPGSSTAPRRPQPAVLRFVRSWGPFAAGDELALPPGDGTLADAQRHPGGGRRQRGGRGGRGRRPRPRRRHPRGRATR